MEPIRRFSVAIVNYGGEAVLEGCVLSLLKASAPSLLQEILLVDNASGDAAVERAAALSPLVRILRLPKNVGYGAGVNHAAKVASGHFLVALNNDANVPEGWLEAFAALFAARGERLLACPLLVDASDPGTINAAGTYLSPLGTTGALHKGERADDLPAELEVPAPSGACLVAPKALFDELGGFDESLFMYCEDLDLGWRARLRGAAVVLVSTVRVVHRTAGARRESPRYYSLTTRNRLLVIRRNAVGAGRLRLTMVGFVTGTATAVVLAGRGAAPLGSLLRALHEGLATPVPPARRAPASRTVFQQLSLADTIRHLLRQGQSHLT